MKRQLLLASRNPGKTVEIRALFSGLNLEILSLMDYPEIPETVEDGETLEANAIKKAVEACTRTGIPSIADDTGLEVYSLNMEPGVRSARYAGENVTYAENNAKLLTALGSLPDEARGARFRCVAAFADGNIVRTFEGECPGTILKELRGSHGFGYDPLFVPQGYDSTFAELDLLVKNRISHRARAFEALRSFILSDFAV